MWACIALALGVLVPLEAEYAAAGNAVAFEWSSVRVLQRWAPGVRAVLHTSAGAALSYGLGRFSASLFG